MISTPERPRSRGLSALRHRAHRRSSGQPHRRTAALERRTSAASVCSRQPNSLAVCVCAVNKIHDGTDPLLTAWLWRSVLSPFAERYCEYLLERGYAPSTVNRYVKCVAHFAHWVAKRRIPAARVDYRLVNSFVANHLSHCTCPDPIPRSAVDVRAALQHLLVVLGVRAVPWFLRDEPDAIRDEVCRFIQHLEDVCGLADCTRYQRGRIVRDFLRQQFGDKCIDIAQLQIRDIYRFVTQYPDACGPGVAKVRNSWKLDTRFA
jgi:integrase/recombinase XerD